MLLILAGITINAITGSENAMKKAQEARTKNDEGAAKEQATILVTGYIQDYLNGKYVNETETASNEKEYIKNRIGTGKTEGEYTFTVDGDELIITKGTEELASGSILDDGIIEWYEQGYWKYDHETQTVKKGDLTLNIGDYVKDTGTQTVSGFDGKWRVLGVEKGQLLLVTDTYNAPFEDDADEGIKKVQVGPSGNYGLKLKGADGWNNGIKKLNSIGAIYNNDKLENGRSIKVEDINKITGYNPNNIGVNDPKQTGTGTPYKNEKINQYKNKVTYTLENGRVYYQGTKAITKKTQSTVATFKPLGERGDITEPYTVDSTAYMYYPTTLTEVSDDNQSVGLAKNSVEYDMLFRPPYTPYWIASPCVDASEYGVGWTLFIVNSGAINLCGFWTSGNGEYSDVGALGVRTVVSLKSDIIPTFSSKDKTTGISTYQI